MESFKNIFDLFFAANVEIMEICHNVLLSHWISIEMKRISGGLSLTFKTLQIDPKSISCIIILHIIIIVKKTFKEEKLFSKLKDSIYIYISNN